jgi:hypothetical protein
LARRGLHNTGLFLRCARRAEGLSENIEQPYGRAKRAWVMDRVIPTKEVLKEMRGSRIAGGVSGGDTARPPEYGVGRCA